MNPLSGISQFLMSAKYAPTTIMIRITPMLMRENKLFKYDVTLTPQVKNIIKEVTMINANKSTFWEIVFNPIYDEIDAIVWFLIAPPSSESIYAEQALEFQFHINFIQIYDSIKMIGLLLKLPANSCCPYHIFQNHVPSNYKCPKFT